MAPMQRKSCLRRNRPSSNHLNRVRTVPPDQGSIKGVRQRPGIRSATEADSADHASYQMVTPSIRRTRNSSAVIECLMKQMLHAMYGKILLVCRIVPPLLAFDEGKPLFQIKDSSVLKTAGFCQNYNGQGLMPLTPWRYPDKFLAQGARVIQESTSHF